MPAWRRPPHSRSFPVPPGPGRPSRWSARSAPMRSRRSSDCASGSRFRPSPTWASTMPRARTICAGSRSTRASQQAKVIPTKGVPAVFATLDAGAPVTLGIYFMYDVKHYDPAEWTSPPLEARLVDRPGEGKAIVGRGAVNQKGPETAFLAAVQRVQDRGRQASGQSRPGRRGRGGNRLAQLPAGARESRSAGRAEQGGGHLHPPRGPEQHRRGLAQPRRQGRDRGAADLERREMGPRARTRTSIRA